jgi:hypothetical protein
MDLEELNKRIRVEVDLKNNQPLDDFNGRTPSEMHYLIHMPFDKDSPMQVNDNIDQNILLKIPIVEITLSIMKIIDDNNGIKLTTKGNLPVKVAKQLYELGNFPSKYIDSGFSKITSEEDLGHIHSTRIVMEIARITRKQKGKLLLTKKGKKYLLPENLHSLFVELFQVYTLEFNWAYNDHFDDTIGQFGFAFSLDMVNTFGDKYMPVEFYALSYWKAFPMIADEIEERMYMSKEKIIVYSFEIRIFYYFMSLFGLIEMIDKHDVDKPVLVKKSELFNQVLKFDE